MYYLRQAHLLRQADRVRLVPGRDLQAREPLLRARSSVPVMDTRLRTNVLERDRYRCRGCLTTRGRLEVHHILYRSQGGPDALWNLISLCRQCHGRAHGVTGTRVAPWIWTALVQSNQWGWEKALLYKACQTCSNRDQAFNCFVWDQVVQPQMVCGQWELRPLETPH